MATDSSVDPATPTPNPAAKKRRKGCGCWTILLVLAGLFVGVPLLLALATFAWIRIVDSYALAEELELAREAGYPLTLEELDASYPTSPEIEAATQHWQKAIAVVENAGYQEAKAEVPVIGSRWNAWTARHEVNPIDDTNLEQGRAFVTAHAEALEAAHAARLAGATARFPLESDELLDEDVSHAQSLREVADLLTLDLEIRLNDGDADAAVEDVLTLIAASEALANEPHPVTQLVRNALIGIAADSLTTVLSRVELSDAQLIALQEAFARQRPLEGFRRALQGERYAVQHLLRGDWELDEPGIEKGGFRLSEEGDIAKSLEFFRRLEEILDQDATSANRDFEPLFIEWQELAPAGYLTTFRYLGTILSQPMLEALSHASSRSDATCRLAETAIVFERYRLKHGSLPPSPDAIVPAYVDALPIDIYDGNPVRWRVVEAKPAEKVGPLPPEEQMYPEDAEERIVKPAVPAGIMYYSVWSNGKDDGGIDLDGGFEQTRAMDLLYFVPDRVSPDEQAAPSTDQPEANED